MSSVVIVGTQWGDEGKGKITDYLAEQADIVMRYQGGSNAGHTVEAKGKQYKLHLVPSGILYPDKQCLIGHGVVLDPEELLQEIDMLISQGIDVSNLRISDRAHLVFPYHKLFDGLEEDKKGDNDIGTTRKGIGPAYMDKSERIGIRVCDLMNEDVFRNKLKANLQKKNEILTKIYEREPFDVEEMTERYLEYGKKLSRYVADTTVIVYEALKAGKKVLFEGAQGTLLDLDLGTYPYVTSSHPIAGGVCVGAGIGPTMIDKVVGVAKAYTTRVGKGPFPTELFDEIGNSIREKGHEYGTTTGRPRRCGWFDAVIVSFSVRVSGITDLAITKLDTLAGLDTVKICTAYRKGDEIVKNFPASLEYLAECEPVYEELPGWDDRITQARTYDELPENAKRYVERIEELCGARASILSVGPGREQTIIR
ncbi:Adenylosuccinate synthetase [Caldanaerobius fijiensis DSM 17918]|uniref:Adenylosuccinate synthetase n=1 Tax=Caldanaerobius fijiensis DSM 17918 TaxID=1121256 RepID=A0A1M5CXM5_9THEO|nr:adenylosuccinate synthase [Caldanaerobius fijiensis]SHF59421.1 Adenylosuccinate synthetase [Caldanaerobius fijiensis DSM 17918]